MERLKLHVQCPICGESELAVIYYNPNQKEMQRKVSVNCRHKISILIVVEEGMLIVQSASDLRDAINPPRGRGKLASEKQLLYIRGLIKQSNGLTIYNRFMESLDYTWETLTSSNAIGVISHLKEYSTFKEEWESCYEDYQSLSEEIWLAGYYDFNIGPDQPILEFGVQYINTLKKENENA